MKTTRWPRRRRTSPIPTQLFVGPKAPSGKKTIVRESAGPGVIAAAYRRAPVNAPRGHRRAEESPPTPGAERRVARRRPGPRGAAR
jgi:hypothetical protein